MAGMVLFQPFQGAAGFKLMIELIQQKQNDVSFCCQWQPHKGEIQRAILQVPCHPRERERERRGERVNNTEKEGSILQFK